VVNEPRRGYPFAVSLPSHNMGGPLLVRYICTPPRLTVEQLCILRRCFAAVMQIVNCTLARNVSLRSPERTRQFCNVHARPQHGAIDQAGDARDQLIGSYSTPAMRSRRVLGNDGSSLLRGRSLVVIAAAAGFTRTP
jgi:hypothetical protein